MTGCGQEVKSKDHSFVEEFGWLALSQTSMNGKTVNCIITGKDGAKFDQILKHERDILIL